MTEMNSEQTESLFILVNKMKIEESVYIIYEETVYHLRASTCPVANRVQQSLNDTLAVKNIQRC